MLKNIRSKTILQLGAAALIACHGLTVSISPALAADQHSEAEGTVHGFSQEGLDKLDQHYADYVDEGRLKGVVLLLARHGEIVLHTAHGERDGAADLPMEKDTVFRIASMTKPIAGVAMMQLWEEGKWKLDDPVSKYIPEFENLMVKTADGGTEPQESSMTMRQLMSHQAGFGVSSVYADADLRSGDLQDMIDKLATLPLETQPGTAWDYGPSVDIQGYIVEKLSGMDLEAYLDTKIFEPLGMTDTGFWIAPEEAERVTAIYQYNVEGELIQLDAGPRTEKPAFLSGSGGLMSTAKDYYRFAQALLNGGELDGARILKPETVELMATDVLEAPGRVDLYGPSIEGIGFGMDFAIVLDPETANTQQGKGSYYWGGYFGTWFWIDPENDLVFVGMIQNNASNTSATPPVKEDAYRLVAEALVDKGE